MSFGNIFFIFIFLPITLAVYFAVPGRFVQAKNAVLLVFSLLFYSWGNPQYLWLLLLSLVFNYAAVLEMEKVETQYGYEWARVSMVVTVTGNLLLLGIFKYYGFLIENINALFGLHLHGSNLTSPIGISFYTFTVLSYVFDVWYQKAYSQQNFLSFALFACFFPKLVSGPIVEYRDFEEQILYRKTSRAKLGAGINRFMVGLAKKVLIADRLGTTFDAIHALGNMSVMTAWLGMICYSLELYFDFSGYSDMAIGIAQMFGFDFSENFNYPYCAEGITDFWRRWHISLGGWFRDYVYIPLGGNRCEVPRHVCNLLIVWFLTGLWHGSSWNFIVWGLWHGCFVLLEKYVLKDFLPNWPKAARIFYTVVVSFFGWVWFFNDSLGSALRYFGQMFGAGRMGIIDSTAVYYLTSCALVVLLAAIGSGPLVKNMHHEFVYRSGKTAVILSSLAYLVIFVLCIAGLVSSTYSSFLYFQF